jgi:uncharacterized membrane protein YtjA (UPF0391 family)
MRETLTMRWFAIVPIVLALIAAFFFGFGVVWEGTKVLCLIGFLIYLVLAMRSFLREKFRRRSV